MLTADELSQRRSDISSAADLAGGVATIERRLARLLEEPPRFPETKAMLSVDGGVCPDDATALTFDPWSPEDHRCPTCHQIWSGDRHHRAWARWQHLWLAERAGDLATLAVLTDHEAARARASEILCWYGHHYAEFPNVDNVLGPARVFFSTYLESIWLENLMAAGFLLAETGQLDQAANDAISAIADPAATIIGEYDERLSNRQTWNNAALLSIAVWFEDEELAHRCIEGTTGLIAHLLHGYMDLARTVCGTKARTTISLRSRDCYVALGGLDWPASTSSWSRTSPNQSTVYSSPAGKRHCRT